MLRWAWTELVAKCGSAQREKPEHSAGSWNPEWQVVRRGLADRRQYASLRQSVDPKCPIIFAHRQLSSRMPKL